MADDDIERLLREVNAVNSGSSSRGSSDVEPATSRAVEAAGRSSTGGRVAFAVGASLVFGAAGWFLGLLMPFVGSFSCGVGAALGSLVTGLVAGPPRWFSS